MRLETSRPQKAESDIFWDDEWFSIVAGEHFVGFIVVDVSLFLGIEVKASAEAVGGIGQMYRRAGYQ